MKVYYINLLKLLRRTFGLAVIAGTIALFFTIIQQSVPITSESPAQIINKVQTEQEAVAITFNVEPGCDIKPVLETLNEHKIKSTFFISPGWAQNNPQLMNRLSMKNHETSIFLDTSYYRDNSSLLNYMENNKEVFQDLTGNSPTLIRFKRAEPEKENLENAYSLGYQIIGGTHLNQNNLESDAGWVEPGNIISISLNKKSNPSQLVSKMSEVIKENDFTAVTVSKLLSWGPGAST